MLEAEGLSKRYRRDRDWALEEVDLEVRSGAIAALVGPNGAGKSTLIRSFMGFEAPTSGSVRMVGLDPWRNRAMALRNVGYVGQDPALYQDLTVQDHLAMAAALRSGFDPSTARQRLEELQIPRSARGGDLSGGQKAQVALAIALGTHAPILLLDEPIASLDPLARHEFLNVLRGASATEGTTVMLSSHIVGDLEAVCDSLIIIARGRVALHASISVARASHKLVEDGDPIRGQIVATMVRPDGRRVSLARVDAGTGNASMDDIVLGYLAASQALKTAA